MSKNNNVILNDEEFEKVFGLLEEAANYMRASKNPEWTITETIGEAMNILLKGHKL